MIIGATILVVIIIRKWIPISLLLLLLLLLILPFDGRRRAGADPQT
jgi:hypothetical protein